MDCFTIAFRKQDQKLEAMPEDLKYSRQVAREADVVPAAGRERSYRTARWAKRFVKFASLDKELAFHRDYAFLGRSDLPSVLNKDLETEVDRELAHHAEIYKLGSKRDHINRKSESRGSGPSLPWPVGESALKQKLQGRYEANRSEL